MFREVASTGLKCGVLAESPLHVWVGLKMPSSSPGSNEELHSMGCAPTGSLQLSMRQVQIKPGSWGGGAQSLPPDWSNEISAL